MSDRKQYLVVCGLLCAAACSALAAEPIVLRASVTPAEVWVGQRAILRIEVLGREGWAQIKRLGDFEVPGTYVLRTQSQGTRLQETIAGTAYTGQQYELSLYPQRAGRITIPALPVDVMVKVWGVNAQETRHAATIPPTPFTCKVPPGAEGVHGLISTTRCTATQSWTPEILDVNVGDAIKRTIEMQASDVSGMAFAPMQHPATEGVGIYPGEPTVEDATDRGTLTGKRIESVTYVCERAGTIEIPAVTVSWWDVGVQQLKRIELPGQTLTIVGEVTAPATTATDSQPPQNALHLWIAFIVAGLTAVLLFRYRRRMTVCWRACLQARDQTEGAYFRSAMQAVRSGDALATLRATMRWLDRINVDPRPARLDRFLNDFGDDSAAKASANLAISLSAKETNCDLSAFCRGLVAARSHWRRRRRQMEHVNRLLPELNGPSLS